MNTLYQDLRYSARLLWNKRGYSIGLILTLALGICALTSVFSVVNAVLLKPYGPVNTDRWAYLWEHRLKSQSMNQISVSMPNFSDWKRDSTSVFSRRGGLDPVELYRFRRGRQQSGARSGSGYLA